MAEIPVVKQEKKGIPGWVWLLPLLLLGLLGLLFARSCAPAADNNNNVNNVNNVNTRVAANTNYNANTNATITNTATTTTNVTNTTSGNITDAAIFGSTADKMSLVNRRAELGGVKVARVLSDRVFTVTSGTGEMFAMLDENLDSAGGREQGIRMQPGQTVSLGGTFQRVGGGSGNAEVKDERNRDLNSREFAQMKDQQVYLHVTNVRNQ